VNVSLRIARRYLRTRHATGFITLLAWISIVGVTIGVAALIVVPAVMNGFEQEVRSRIAGTNAHVLLLSFDEGGIPDTTRVLKALRRRPGVLGVSPFVYSKALVTKEGTADGIIVKGVDLAQERAVTTVANDITPALAAIPDSGAAGPPGIVLGSEVAARLRARVGETVVLATIHGGLQSPLGLVPRLVPFRVVGIFESGLYEYDSSLAYVSLAEAQRLFDVAGVTGVQIRLADLFAAPAFARAMVKDLGGYPFRSSDWVEQNANLFRFMKIEKATMFLILAYIATRTGAIWPIGVVEEVEPLGILSKLVEVLTVLPLLQLMRSERAARLTAPGSALVANLSQKIVAPRDVCFALDASRRKAVHDAEDTASLLSFGQYNLCWIGGRAEDAADLRNHLDRIQYIDRVEAIA